MIATDLLYGFVWFTVVAGGYYAHRFRVDNNLNLVSSRAELPNWCYQVR